MIAETARNIRDHAICWLIVLPLELIVAILIGIGLAFIDYAQLLGLASRWVAPDDLKLRSVREAAMEALQRPAFDEAKESKRLPG